MPEHSDQSLSSEEYNALLVDVTQWLEQARKQAGRAVNALMTTTYWRISYRTNLERGSILGGVAPARDWMAQNSWTVARTTISSISTSAGCSMA
jgi:hypothetical protein